MPTFDPTKSFDESMLAVDLPRLNAAGKKIVYLLWDPRPNDLRCYVGQTSRVDRFRGHYGNVHKDRTYESSEAKALWMTDLRANSLQFNVSLLEACDSTSIDEREKYWIGVYEESPYHILCNSTTGRAEACSVYGPESVGPLHPVKPGFVCEIESLEECWTARRLLRTKRVTKTDKRPEWHALHRKHWERTLSETEFAVLEGGLKGEYTERRIQSAGPLSFSVRLCDFVIDAPNGDWRILASAARGGST